MPEPSLPINAAIVAGQLAERLDGLGQEYALGGAIALGYWGMPRGTIDVDLTLYIPPEHSSECVLLLQELGCELSAHEAIASIREHGFCSVYFHGIRLDVFLPIIPFYEAAKTRRRQMDLTGHSVKVWDAESLTVFKMMFFRRKDLADIEQILRTQGKQFDRNWVREQLAAMYGGGDPRLAAWDEISHELNG